ncbi:MAG: helix-hairpin-helix domain-containing protein [Planctomycetota bacterium]|nr:MAG: helix-hairpin-helix domain-containing protein [Planctomycetota bacterium]
MKSRILLNLFCLGICFQFPPLYSLFHKKDKLYLSRPLVQTHYKVPVNRAGLWEMAILPGIGFKKAAKIMEYRKKHQRIPNYSALRKIPGLGKNFFQYNQDLFQKGLDFSNP